MKTLFDHLIGPSVYCWLDNLLLSKGEAHYEVHENFRQAPSQYQGYNEYLASKPQFVYDSSIPNAIVCSGVYSNGILNLDGFLGLTIDSSLGRALYNTVTQRTVSGDYSAKEINTYATTESEEFLLFEKQNFINPKNLPNWTGRKIDDFIVPCVFVKVKGGGNEALCFGGMAKTEVDIRMTVVTENNFQFNAINGLLRDSKDSHLPILSESQLPFNYLGGLTTGFNYQTIKQNAAPSNMFFIKDVRLSPFNERVNSLIGNKTVAGFIDLTLENIRYPHAG